MNRVRKITHRGATSKQSRISNAAKKGPITRSRSNLFQEDQHEELNEIFVLIQLLSNKKLLVNCLTDLLHLNSKEKIKMGSNVMVKMNNQQPVIGTVFLVGSKRQCFDELDIITIQRENETASRINDDNSDNPPLMITSISTESIQKKSFENGYSNSSEATKAGMSIDDITNESNHLSPRHISSSTSTPNSNRSILTNHNQNVPSVTSSKSSIEILTTSPRSPRAPSNNQIASTTTTVTTTNSQCARMDPMARMVLKLEQITDDRDKWKKKYELLEEKYNKLENSSIMVPGDEPVCEWICMVHDSLQRKKNMTVDFNEESKILGIPSELLKFYVNQKKPSTIIARKLFQHICPEELSNGVHWSGIPTDKVEALQVFGEKVFGLIKWNRKVVKISLQNLVRGERSTMNHNPAQDDLQAQNPHVGDLVADDEEPIEDMD